MHDDISKYMEDKLSPYLCRFRKGYSTQYCLMVMLERLKKPLTKLEHFLQKCLNHQLLIAKLDASGFDHNSLNIILSYLSRRKHRTKVNNHLSDWTDILSGIPQGSILGLLLFNIYINDIFYFILEDRVANYADDTTPYTIKDNYADDTTPYTIKDNYAELIDSLQLESNILLDWFKNNFFKLNADKCKLLVSNKQSVKLLGIKIANKHTFNKHMLNLCKKVSNKLHALARVSLYCN